MSEAQFIERLTEILSEVPEEFRDVIHDLAYEIGHGSGYHDVLSYAQDFVNKLQDPIENYRETISKNVAYKISSYF